MSCGFVELLENVNATGLTAALDIPLGELTAALVLRPLAFYQFWTGEYEVADLREAVQVSIFSL